MPRTSGITIQNNFSQGLITESTPLNFPKNASTDADNVVFDYTGRVIRRQEIDLEENYSIGSSLAFTNADAYTEFHWQQASDAGIFSFLVQQAGDTLHFYDTTSNNNISQNKNAGTISLSTYKASGTVVVAATNPCQYAQGNGGLIVVNRGTDPILIKYNPLLNIFTASSISIKWRDFAGLTTTYSDVLRPAFANLNALLGDAQGVRHYYNLLNQGWWQGTISGGFPSTTSPLGMWDADTTSGSPAVGTFPSNSDYMGYYRASVTVSYDANRLISSQQGTTLSPKGHFILPLGNTDRRQAVIDSGYTLDLSGIVGTYIPYGTGTQFQDSNLWSNAVQAFDGNYNYSTSRASRSGTYNNGNGYIGKDLGSGNAKKIDSVRWYGYRQSSGSGNSGGSNGTLSGYGGAHHTYGVSGAPTNNYSKSSYLNLSLQLRASNTAPVSGTSGTLLGTATFYAGQSAAFAQVNSSDKLNTYRYVWVYASYSPSGSAGGTFSNGSLGCSEIEFYESKDITNNFTYNDPEVTTERPQACAYYAGRAWYGAINSSMLSTNLYFSQIIEKDDQYGKCYQQNDPTSESFFDLLDSDGGVVKIPEMGILQSMFVYQTTLILIATNGVWIVRGSSGNAFKATDYVVRKISAQGSTSPLSVIDVQGIPYWFSDSGILRINYNPQFDSFSVDSLTDTTIRSFYLDIPLNSRANVKGDYDQYLQLAYWLYNDGTAPEPFFNHILIYNNRTNGFFYWSMDVDTATPGIVGIKFIQDILGGSVPKLKLTTTLNIDSSHQYMTYADIDRISPSYYDWTKWATEIKGDSTQKIDFSSYFVTNYELDGETQRFVQPNYVMLFIDQPYDENGDRIEQSAYLRGVFDFAISGDTGKWSSTAQSSQQIFNENLPNRSVNFRRLKIRGKGRCLQFRVHSESGKPFSVVGWSVWKTANSQD